MSMQPHATTAVPCPDCHAAQSAAAWGGIRADCQGCKIRALAVGVEFFVFRGHGAATPAYRAALQAVFGPDVKAGQALVVAEHNRIAALRRGV